MTDARLGGMMYIRTAGRIDFGAVNRAALDCLPSLVRQWLPDGKQCRCEWIARNPTRADRHPGSFSINLTTGRWADFATDDAGGDVISLRAYIFSTSQSEAARSLAADLGVQL